MHPFKELGRDRDRSDAVRACRQLHGDARPRQIRTADHRQTARGQAPLATGGDSQPARLFLTRHLVQEEARMHPIHVLAAIVVLLVLYLFYAVINPEKF